jgi:hypothetical protein
MGLQTLKARGHQGHWFARIGDEDVPCVWRQWKTGVRYLDPGAKIGEGKWVKYIEAIKQGKKVALTGKREKDGKWIREGYIALFEVGPVTVTEQGLEFEFVKRLANLK